MRLERCPGRCGERFGDVLVVGDVNQRESPAGELGVAFEAVSIGIASGGGVSCLRMVAKSLSVPTAELAQCMIGAALNCRSKKP